MISWALVAALGLSMGLNALLVVLYYKTVGQLTLKIMARDADKYVQITKQMETPKSKPATMSKEPQQYADLDALTIDQFEDLVTEKGIQNG